MMRLTQSKLESLRATVRHAAAGDIGATWNDGADPKHIEDLDAYLRHFAAPKYGADGKVAEGHPCLHCEEPLAGGLMSLLGRGGFEWGLVHGQGHCRNCGWPATAYHFVKDRDGAELLSFRNVILQAHPNDIEIKDPST